MKVLYLTTVPTPYKVAFFEEFGKLCDLTVLFENKQVSYREKSYYIKAEELDEFQKFIEQGVKSGNIK